MIGYARHSSVKVSGLLRLEDMFMNIRYFRRGRHTASIARGYERASLRTGEYAHMAFHSIAQAIPDKVAIQ